MPTAMTECNISVKQFMSTLDGWLGHDAVPLEILFIENLQAAYAGAACL